MTGDRVGSRFKSRALVVACGMLLVTGCVYRSLTIRTEPPGALVYVNDKLRGKSPITYDFMWYGIYSVTLRKDGFERLDDRRLLNTPIYLWIPFDLAMELLPFPVRDARTWSYTLTPEATAPTPVPPPLISRKEMNRQISPASVEPQSSEENPQAGEMRAAPPAEVAPSQPASEATNESR